MKKLLKIFGYIILSLFLFTIILVVTASLSQKKIVDIVLKKISTSVSVPIEIEDLSFTLIKRFPYATFEFSGVKIGAAGNFDSDSLKLTKEDILNIKSIYVSVKTIPLIKGEYEIIKVEIDGASMNYKIDSLGRSNIDFLINMNAKDSALIDTSATLSTLDLKKIRLKNTAIYYVNDSTKIAANLFFPSLNIAGKFADEKYTGTVAGDLRLTECSLGSSNLNRMEDATFDFKLNYKTDTLQIKKLEANTDGANVEVTGKMAFANNLYTDLTFASTDLDLSKLLKYAPDNLLNELGIGEVTGKLQLSGTVKGIVSDTIMPGINLAFDLKNGNAKVMDYPAIQKINFEGEFSNGNEQNNKTSSAIFKSFHAETDSSSADLVFSLTNLDKPNYTLNSKLNINLEEFKDFIPDTLIQNISGVIGAELSTKGQVPDSIDDNFINLVVENTSAKVDFSNLNIERDSFIVIDFSGSLIYSPGQLEMNSINIFLPDYGLNLTNSSFNAEFTGLVTQPQYLGVHFKTFNIESLQGKVWGSANIKNMEHPDFVADAYANLNLSELKPFLPDTLVKSLSGNLAAEISSHGKLNLDSIAEQVNDIVFKQSKITLDAKNISVTLPDTLQKLTNFSGLVKVAHDTISISKMSGVAAGMDFSIDAATIANVYNALIMKRQDAISILKMSGVAAGMDYLIDSATIVNVYNAVIMNKQETVSIYGILEFGAIDYSMFAPFLAAYSSENTVKANNKPEIITNKNTVEENTSSIESRNFSYEFKGKIAAKSFKYEKMLMENITAKINVSDSVYIIDQFKANAFDGTTNSAVRFSQSADGKQIVNIKSIVNRMDINKFLYAFDNFGYDSLISYNNISGLFSVDLHGRFVFDADTLVTNDMRIMGDLTLENGRLINYQPAMDVASFTGIKELDNIELKTVKSSIFMFKNKMYVPATDVVSTSMDFSTFGMQSMGDDYEYHLQMKLGEVLRGKSKKLIERQSSSGDEINEKDIDKNTIKIIYANMYGKEKTGFDNKKAQKAMELKIQVQQKMLDLIFHPKLVSFETGVK